jgi:hypothetical protein
MRQKNIFYSLLLLCSVIIVSFLITSSSFNLAEAQEKKSTIQPRLQWNANHGYCGEVSLISAGMQLGQYTSQWTARRLASPGINQTATKSQLLLGVNDLQAARKMRLRGFNFNNSKQKTSRQFIRWIKNNFLENKTVIIGVYENMPLFNSPNRRGDQQYDHIVPITGIRSFYSLKKNKDKYYPNDRLFFSDNGLYTGNNRRQFIFNFSFKKLLKTRQQANKSKLPYSIRSSPRNYGLVVGGVADRNRVTAPIRLTSNYRGQGITRKRFINKPLKPFLIKLQATVTIPNNNEAYNVYLYNSFNSVPVNDFNKHANQAIRKWVIPANSNKGQRTINIVTESDKTRVFRAVPVSSS